MFRLFGRKCRLNIAEQFLTDAKTSFGDLALNPWMGSPLALQNPKLSGMRKWRVKNFNNILIFYMPRHDGVTIVHVIHAAQDWWSLLGLA